MKPISLIFLFLKISLFSLAQEAPPVLYDIDNQHQFVSFMYDNRVGDSYSLGLMFKPVETPLRISGIFFEGSYGGLVGKKEYKELLEWAWEDTFSVFSSRYSRHVSPKVDIKQRNWSIATCLMPAAYENFYFGMGITSVRLNQIVQAYSDSEVWARSVNTSYDILGGVRLFFGGVFVDLRIGYPLFRNARQSPGDTGFIREYYKMSSKEYDDFKSMWDAAIRENAIDFLKEGLFFGFQIGLKDL